MDLEFKVPCPMMMPMGMGKMSYGGRIQLTRAFVPDQPYTDIFPPEEALRRGTLFPNLAIPYEIKSKE